MTSAATCTGGAGALPGRHIDIGFELSNLCNLHCTHCIRGSHQVRIESLDLDLFGRILAEAGAAFDSVGVVFTGGEPLASPLFPPAVEQLAARGIPYRFVTNGWLVPRHVKLLERHRPQFVRISLSGASARTHDEQRGDGSFRRALLAAAILLTRDIRTEMSMVVTRESRAEIADAVALANDLGLAEFHFILPQPTPESALAGSDLAPDEWNRVTSEVLAYARESAAPIGIDYGTWSPLPRAACGTMAQRQIYVDAAGRVPFCCQLSRYGTGPEPIIGDLTRETLATVLARGRGTYDAHAAETTLRHAEGRRDALDDFPCMSCARRNGRTGFLAEFPDHPWTALGRRIA